jgi:hypothetical protein
VEDRVWSWEQMGQGFANGIASSGLEELFYHATFVLAPKLVLDSR